MRVPNQASGLNTLATAPVACAHAWQKPRNQDLSFMLLHAVSCSHWVAVPSTVYGHCELSSTVSESPMRVRELSSQHHAVTELWRYCHIRLSQSAWKDTLHLLWDGTVEHSCVHALFLDLVCGSRSHHCCRFWQQSLYKLLNLLDLLHMHQALASMRFNY